MEVDKGMIFETASYESCRDELLAFRNMNRAETVDRTYTEWRYLLRPNSGSGLILWARESNGDRVGMVSLLPVRYVIEGQEMVCASSGDFSVRSDHRGKGLGKAMLRQLLALEETRTFGVALVITTPEIANVFRGAGYREASEWSRHVRVIDVPQGQGFKGRFSTWVCAVAGDALAWAVSMTQRDVRGWEVQEVGSFDERFDELWAGIDKRKIVIAVRDRAFLRWRFELHPSERYKILSVASGERPCGYLVYGLKEGSCTVVDLLFNDDRALAALLNSLVHKLRAEGSAYRITLVLGANGGGWIPLRAGFIGRPDRHPLLCWNPPARDAAPIVPWYITAADKDV